jgi:hypothetical protein
MPSPGWIRLLIAVAAAIMLLVSLLSGGAEGAPGLRSVGVATSVLTLAVLLFDRSVWRWPLLRRLSELAGTRILHGTWRGTYSYTDDGSGNEGSAPLYLAIHQTYSQIRVRAYFPATGSTSISLLASLRGEDHRHVLRYVFQHTAQPPDRDANRPTEGVCELAVVGSPVEELTGSYYAERGGKGLITLRQHSSRVAGSAVHAARLDYLGPADIEAEALSV